MTIEFHEKAAAHFNVLAQELLTKARTLPSVQSHPSAKALIYPVARLNESDVIGVGVAWKQRSVNGLGKETARSATAPGVRTAAHD